MNKKIVGIVAAAIVLILAIVIAVFALKGKEQGEVDKTINSGQVSNSVTDEDIKNIQGYLKGKTENEIKDILDKPLTQEQQNQLAQIEADHSEPTIIEVLPDDNPNDTKYQAVAEDGTIYEVDDPFLAMTDEEVEEYIKAVRDELQSITNSDTDDGERVTIDPNDFMENPRTPEYYIDQDLIDAGFEAEVDPDTGEITYINPNQEDDGSTGLTTGIELTDPSEVTGGPKLDNPWDDNTEISYGGGD